MGMGGTTERAYCGAFALCVLAAFTDSARPTKAKPAKKPFMTSLLIREGAA
jgi:hypothetical protein